MEVLAKKMAMVKCSGQIVKCMQGSPDPWAKAQDYVARAIHDKTLSKSKGKGALVYAACWIAEQYKIVSVQKGNLEEKVHCLNLLVVTLTFSVENAAAITVSNQQTTAEYKQVCIENERLKQRLRDAESLVATFRKAGADHSNCKSELKQLNAQLGARDCVVSAVKVEKTAKNDRNVTDVKCIKDSNMNCELAVKSKMLNEDCYRQAKPPIATLKCTENRTVGQKQDVRKVQFYKPVQHRKQPGSERVFAIKATHPEKQSVYSTDKKCSQKKVFRCYACSRVGHIARNCTVQFNNTNNHKNVYNGNGSWKSSRWGFQNKSKSWNTWIPYHVLKTQNERLSEENSSLKNAWGKFNNELESLKIEISQMKRTKDDVNQC
uniref:Gag-like protein n=1 Tax=Xenopus laevis TaxID=8355 RepID=Q9IAT8_XENLA|nr:gag-like protein [Xenopus laevis]